MSKALVSSNVNENKRPPKMTTQDAEYELARGPYDARLKASQRILAIVSRYAKDEDTSGLVPEAYLAELQQKVDNNRDELRIFESSKIAEHDLISELEVVVDEDSLAAQEEQIPLDIFEPLSLQREPQNSSTTNGHALRRAPVAGVSSINRRKVISVASRDKLSQPISCVSAKVAAKALAAAMEGDFGSDDWQSRGLCAQTDPEAHFPEKGGSTREAKRVCLSCDVRQECLDYALENDEKFGIWGGLSEKERRKLKTSAV